MTFNDPIWARSAMSPSVIPSARYELSGLLARSRNGSTATVRTRGPARAGRAVRPATNHHAAAATSTPAPSAATARRLTRGPGRPGCRVGAAGGAAAVPGDSSASRKRWIEAKRSAGSFAMACMIAPSTAGGTVWRTTRRLGTASSECRAMTAWGEGPVKGG